MKFKQAQLRSEISITYTLVLKDRQVIFSAIPNKQSILAAKGLGWFFQFFYNLNN